MAQLQDIERYLTGLQFPADRRDVIETARRNNAPENVIRQLEQVPSGKFHSMNNVREHVEAAMSSGGGTGWTAGA